MDSLVQFLAECCVVERRARVSMGRLYAAYETWCRDNGARPIGQRIFGHRLAERGVV